MINRTARLVAALILGVASETLAQSSIRITISRGPHAGTYEMKNGQCDALKETIISMFTAKLAGLPEGPKTPESMEVYTEPGKGKPHGLAVKVDFRAPDRKRIRYEIYAIPPELQGPGLNKPPSGQGTVAIEQKGTATTATFRGQTKDGVGMEGNVTCIKGS